jgi:hypothetical protein
VNIARQFRLPGFFILRGGFPPVSKSLLSGPRPGRAFFRAKKKALARRAVVTLSVKHLRRTNITTVWAVSEKIKVLNSQSDMLGATSEVRGLLGMQLMTSSRHLQRDR